MAAWALAQPAQAAREEGSRYRILFYADRNGNGIAEPYVMDGDGSHVRALVPMEALEEGENDDGRPPPAPVKTPELAGVIFRTISTQGLYRVDAEGLGRRLTSEAGAGPYALSPDGTKLLIMTRKDDDAELYVMDASGGPWQNISRNPSSEDEAASWSPDGRRIVFSSDRDGDDDIYTMAPDGSALLNLTHNDASDTSPAWSPDGTKIVYDSDQDGNHELYVVNADGSGLTRLTTNPADDGMPSWSPDGTRIVFVSDRGGHPDVYAIDPDGSHLTPLTTDGIWRAPVWSPDGAQLAFMSEKDGDLEIYTMHADGSHIMRLTHEDSDDLFDRWLPAPQP